MKVVAAIFLSLLTTCIYPQFDGTQTMNATEFYQLPSDSKLSVFKYQLDTGFTAFDKKNNYLFTIFNYDNGPDYESEGLIRIIENNKIGFANLLGDIVIPPSFDFALPFSDELAAVCIDCKIENVDEHHELIDGRWGFIDKSGEIVIPYKYERVVSSFSNGIAKVMLNKQQLTIKKTGEEVKGDAMKYSEWVKLFTKVTELIDKLYLDDGFSVKNLYPENDNYLFSNEDTRYLKTSLYNKDKKLVEYDLIPLADFTIKQDNGLINPQELIVVTDFAVIFKTHQSSNLTSDELKESERFDEYFKEIVDINSLNQLQKEELNYPENVQVISKKVYNYYVDLQVAIPGSKLPIKEEWRKISSNKILCLHLVPDMGEVKTSWIVTDASPLNIYYNSVEDSLLTIFNNSLDQVLLSPESRTKIYADGKEKIRELFNAANSYVNVLYSQYEKRLHNWLLVEGNTLAKPPEENIFGDYEPKRSPDTILDYAPQLTEQFNNFPLAEKNNLTELLKLFEQYKNDAENIPGQWEDGNMILGAKPREYKPSEAELILNEIGNRIKAVVEKKELSNKLNKSIEYKSFVITHVDAMGSGRFFYVDDIQQVKIDLVK